MTNQEALETKYASYPCHCNDQKPLEIYMFFDPLSAECWALEPILKKLKIEYGNYFTLRHILSGKIASDSHILLDCFDGEFVFRNQDEADKAKK